MSGSAQKSAKKSRDEVIALLRDFDRVFVEVPCDTGEPNWVKVKPECKTDEILGALADVYLLGGNPDKRRRDVGWYKKHVILEEHVIKMNQPVGLADYLVVGNEDSGKTFDGLQPNILIPYGEYDETEVQQALEDDDEGDEEDEDDEDSASPGSPKRGRDEDEDDDEHPTKVARKDE